LWNFAIDAAWGFLDSFIVRMLAEERNPSSNPLLIMSITEHLYLLGTLWHKPVALFLDFLSMAKNVFVHHQEGGEGTSTFPNFELYSSHH
jgi:hypothetical protein